LILLATLRILFIAFHTLFWGVPVILLSFFDPYAQRAARLVRFWAAGNLWVCGVKVQTRGQERLNPQHAYLFMSNHQSQFDILALMVALRQFQLRWVAKHELRKVPILGLCMQVTHQVLVDRQNRTQAIAVIRQVKKLLAAGISVLFFPEGTRSRDGHLLPFKPGGFAVAVEAGVPVVPVTINGSRAILPPGDWKVRSGTIEIIFGEPIPLDAQVPKKIARETLLVQVHEAIVASYRPNMADSATATAPAAVSSSPSSEQRNSI
jgi:1-acyl-sn-glycerol-3-phosphate acyltransferase